MPSTTSAFLNVRNIEKSLAFYKELGFRVTNETKDKDTGDLAYADLAFRGAELGLGNIPSNDSTEFRAWVSTPLGAGVVIYFTVDVSVDDIFEKAKRAGAAIESPPTDRSYGRSLMINDPDGYTITFLRETKRPAAARPKKAAKKSARVAKKKAPAKRRR